MRWRPFAGYVRLELARNLRDGRYLLLAIVAPVGFYLLFSSVFAGRSSGHATFGLPAATEIMVAMATFGAMWAALSATAPRLARDREGGWLDYLATTPLRAGEVLLARIGAGLVVAFPAVVAVGVAAAIAHGVRLEAWQWGAGLVLLWLGVLPFVALGIAIGSFATSTVAYAASTGLWFAFAALGGLWVPPGVLSPALRHVAMALPSYNQAALGWHVTSGSAPTVVNGLVLLAWTGAASLLPLTRHRRSGHRGRSSSVAPAGDDAAIHLQRLAKYFGAQPALDRMDLRAPTGQIVALLGPNGSGKTTTMAILLGLLDADQGQARLFGRSPRQTTAAGWVGALLQDSELMAGVGVGPLLRFVRSLYRQPVELDMLVDTIGLHDLLRRRTDRLSVGQAQRVRFALAMAGAPRLLVLDEPTAALDVQGRRDLWNALRDHCVRWQTTVLFSTHYLEEADAQAERIVLLGGGRVVADGTPGAVKAAAGADRVVAFRLLRGSPDRFATAPGVTAVHTEGRRVSLQTTDADATLWALYDQRDAIADIAVAEASLEEAFCNLVTPRTASASSAQAAAAV